MLDTMARDVPGVSTIGILCMGVTVGILVLVALVAPAVLIGGCAVMMRDPPCAFSGTAPMARLRAAAMANLLVLVIRMVFSSLRSDTAPCGAVLS